MIMRMDLSTERLVLREYLPRDLNDVHEFASDPLVCALSEWGPHSIQESGAFLAQCFAESTQTPRMTWTFAITCAGKVIGSIALMREKSDLVRREEEAEIGYVLRRDMWGRGFATEAAGAVMRWAYQEQGISRLVATCRPENGASVRVLEKLGLRQIGYLVGDKIIDGVARDSLLFGSKRLVSRTGLNGARKLEASCGVTVGDVNPSVGSWQD